jgi:cell division protein FtsI/penicillin-binding protein 2
MNLLRRSTTIVLLITIVYLAVVTAIDQRKVTEEEYAAQVLNQYIKYYCPNAGTCDRKKALERLRLDWPHVYRLGFSILEENE